MIPLRRPRSTSSWRKWRSPWQTADGSAGASASAVSSRSATAGAASKIPSAASSASAARVRGTRVEPSERSRERHREGGPGSGPERRLARLGAGEKTRTVERPGKRLRRPADVCRLRHRHGQKRREPREDRELALGARHDDGAPREAEDPFAVDEMDDVVPALAEERDRSLGQRRELLAHEARRELLVHRRLRRPFGHEPER